MKYVHNTHQAEIRVALPAVEDTPASELVLEPGDNAVTPEQYRALRKVPVIVNYFKVGFLRDTSAPPEPVPAEDESEAGDGSDGTGGEKPLDRMNKTELIAKARELNLAVVDEDTKAILVSKIQAAQAQ